MKKLLRFLLLFIWVGAVNTAAAQQYVSTGPDGGAVYAFYRDNTRVLAAGSGGVYASNDEGKNWQELNLKPSTFGCDAIYSVAGAGTELYAGSRQTGIYHSLDGGNTWTATTTGLRIALGAPFTDIEMFGANVLAVRPDSGFLFGSVNRGSTWARMNAAIGNANAQFLSLHKGNVYISTPQGLFKSINGSMTFTNINPLSADFGQLTWSGDTAYVATSNGIRMSLDSGASFIPAGLAGQAVRRLSVAGKHMYAIIRNPAPVQDSVLYSADGGASFTTASFIASTFRFTTVSDLAVTGNGVLVASNYGLYSTGNHGAAWGLSDSGYNATGIRAIAAGGAYIYAAGNPMGVYRTMPDNGPLAWEHSGDMSDGIDGSVQAIAAVGGIVHLGALSGYYRSLDNGISWTAGAVGASGGNVSSIYAAPPANDVWMIRNGNLYYSGDSGTSFGHLVNSNIPPGTAQRVMKVDTIIYVSSYSTLYKGNGSLVFQPVNGLSGFVTAIVKMGNVYYAGTDANGLYLSTDGTNWSAVTVSGVLPPAIHALIPDSAGTGLVAGTDDGLYANPGGGLWSQMALPRRIVQSLAMRNGKLFAGTCSGVYSVPYKAIPPPAAVSSNTLWKPGEIQIWPNPAKGDLSMQIQSAGSGNSELQMRNMLGAVVLRRNVILKRGSNDVHLSIASLSLPAGLYTIHLSGEGIHAAARVVLQ